SRRQVCRDWREYVAPMERRRYRLEPPRRAADVHRLDDPAEPLRGEGEEPVVGPDQEAILFGGAHRDRAPVPADFGVYYREVHARGEVGQRVAKHQRPATGGVPGYPVRDIEDPPVRAAPGRPAG